MGVALACVQGGVWRLLRGGVIGAGLLAACAAGASAAMLEGGFGGSGIGDQPAAGTTVVGGLTLLPGARFDAGATGVSAGAADNGLVLGPAGWSPLLLGLGYDLGGALGITPWIGFVGDVRGPAAADPAGGMLASPLLSGGAAVGIEVTAAPIAFGAATGIVLSAGLSYSYGFEGSPSAGIVEGPSGVYTPRQKTPAQEVRTIGFNLGTELWMSRQLALGAGVGVTHDTVAGRVGSGEFSLIYRF